MKRILRYHDARCRDYVRITREAESSCLSPVVVAARIVTPDLEERENLFVEADVRVGKHDIVLGSRRTQYVLA